VSPPPSLPPSLIPSRTLNQTHMHSPIDIHTLTSTDIHALTRPQIAQMTSETLLQPLQRRHTNPHIHTLTLSPTGTHILTHIHTHTLTYTLTLTHKNQCTHLQPAKALARLDWVDGPNLSCSCFQRSCVRRRRRRRWWWRRRGWTPEDM